MMGMSGHLAMAATSTGTAPLSRSIDGDTRVCIAAVALARTGVPIEVVSAGAGLVVRPRPEWSSGPCYEQPRTTH